jgi:hypothetical protein
LASCPFYDNDKKRNIGLDMVLEKVEKYIYYYKNIVENPDQLIKGIENTDEFCNNNTNISKWDTWTASTDKNLIFGKTKSCFFSPKKLENDNDFEIFKISSMVHSLIKYSVSNYCSSLEIKEPWLPDFFNIRMYNTGADMGPHIDSNDPTDTKHPVLSGVLYLNDNYSGGNISFPNQNISIKPDAGSIIIFPSTHPYLHHPEKILSGNKYMIPFFLFRR